MTPMEKPETVVKIHSLSQFKGKARWDPDRHGQGGRVDRRREGSHGQREAPPPDHDLGREEELK